MIAEHASLAANFAAYVDLYERFDSPEVEARESFLDLLAIEEAVANIPATTVEERRMKSVLATLAGRDTDGGQRIMESLNRDYTAQCTQTMTITGCLN